MPEVGKLAAQRRTTTGKGAARRARVRGRLPAVCYGKGMDPIALDVDPIELRGALDPVKQRNTVIAMTIDGESRPVDVLLRDLHRDPLDDRLLHADFQAVRRDEEVRVTVPVVLLGKPEGVKLGGILHQAYRQIRVACLPDRIPVKVELDVSSLLIGQALHASDLKLGEGVRALIDPKESIASVVAPKEEKTTTETAAEAAATAEAAAGEAGTPAAPGAAPAAAPGAAPGAPAPAAKADDKAKKEDRGKKK
jgi:large subunit ribosomal protein L25